MSKPLGTTVDFVRSWSLELDAAANRVRQLIGSRHWLSDGKHKEAILKNFLKKYINNKMIVSSGFIVPCLSGTPSGEIDILIVSPDMGLPWLSESEIVITPPENVIAHMHVKSSYSKQNLLDVFRSAEAAWRAITKDGLSPEVGEKIWSSAFFFSSDSDNLCSDVERHIKELLALSRCKGSELKAIYVFPDLVVNIKKSDNSSVSVNIKKAERLAVAAFLIQFYESMPGVLTTDLGDFLYSQSTDYSESFQVEVNGDNKNG